MIGGHPIHVIVDDYFPILKDGSWAGVHSSSNDHWMMVVEKAYAKLFGGYGKIRTGFILFLFNSNLFKGKLEETLEDLTGGYLENF